MPLELLEYSEFHVPKDKTLTLQERQYNEFGRKVIALLQDRIQVEQASGKDVFECTVMSDMRVMQRLLGPDFQTSVIGRGRNIPVNTLKAKIDTRRRTCILSGVNRLIVIRETKLP